MKPIQLSWKAYYKNFSELHGGSPVVYHSTFLFQDGWRYGMNSYEGPEYEPKDNVERLRLSIIYWVRRRMIIEEEKQQFDRIVDAIRQIQSERSLPLQQKLMLTEQSENGARLTSLQTLDITVESLLEGKGVELDFDLQRCKDQLETLKAQYKELTNKAVSLESIEGE